MPTKLWAVHAALTDLFTEQLAVPVYDGPVANTTPPATYVLVGTDGGETGTGEANADNGAESEQSWGAIGPTDHRMEQGEVVCAVWSWSGSTDMAGPRATVKDLVDRIEAALLADRHLGDVLKPGGAAEFRRVAWRLSQRKSGAVFRAVVVVGYSAYLS